MARQRPLVAVVMGSDSDWSIMKETVAMLEKLRVACETRVISAHRTPETASEYSAKAEKSGLKVIIAAAGMSAALSGVMESCTTLPVIGVPMASGPLVGIDAALSTMQMPPGVPVACMAIGKAGATNAAIYAAKILALSDESLAKKLQNYKQTMADKVIKKDKAIKR